MPLFLCDGISVCSRRLPEKEPAVHDPRQCSLSGRFAPCSPAFPPVVFWLRGGHSLRGTIVRNHGDTMADNEVTAWVGAVTGCAGLALGAVNFYRGSTLIKVGPRVRRDDSGVGAPFTIHVVNRSGFEVTIERVGLVLKDSAGARETLLLEGFAHGLPKPMPARSSYELHLTTRHIVSFVAAGFDHVFATTSTGKSARSSRWHRFKGKTLAQIQQSAE